mmetsp:Transcript_47008/g.112942  ORF Transcript_47008/g.112942 Transcript_47008/m.112942 type:complete len:107 (-) Transcript_47008:68-388(-)
MEGVYHPMGDKPLFDNLAWFAKKVIGMVCSASACEHAWSIEGWIHSKRRNRLSQPLVEKLVRGHTNMVLRERLDSAMREELPWDYELQIDEPIPTGTDKDRTPSDC